MRDASCQCRLNVENAKHANEIKMKGMKVVEINPGHVFQQFGVVSMSSVQFVQWFMVVSMSYVFNVLILSQ